MPKCKKRNCRKRQKAAYKILEEFTEKGVDVQKIADYLGWRIETDPATDVKTAISRKCYPKIEINELDIRPTQIEITFIRRDKPSFKLFYPKILFPKTSWVIFAKFKLTRNKEIIKRVTIYTEETKLHGSVLNLYDKGFDTFLIFAK